MNSYYVYAYIRRSNNEPYYIGKGKGNRAFIKHTNVSTPTDVSKIVFLERNLTELGALAIERRMIRWYGKKSEGGVLLNVLDGGDNPPSQRGKVRSEAHCRAISKSKLGVKRSEEARKSISVGKKGKKQGPCSDLHKNRVAEARKGKRWFKNLQTNECICCYPGQEPVGWVPGMIKTRSEDELLSSRC